MAKINSKPIINGQSLSFAREIGLSSAILFVTGIIVGSGIFVSPQGVFSNANCSISMSLLVWIICGFYSMLGAVVYSELGTTITRSGGDYAYILQGLGPLISFLYLWLNLIVIRPASQAILALTFAYYLLEPFQARNSCSFLDFEITSRVIAIIVLIFLGAVNSLNVSWSLKLQNIFTGIKMAALSAIVCAGAISAYYNGLPENNNSNSFVSETKCRPHYSLSIYSGLFAFGGWNYLNIVTEELRDPFKNLPIAAMSGIFLSTTVYVLANIAYFAVLNADEILTSPAIALTFARKLTGSLGSTIFSIAISASAFSSLNGTLFTSSRLFTIAAQEKQLPVSIAMLHYKNRTPILSLFVSVVMTFFMLFFNDIYKLINYFSFTNWLWTGIAVISGIYLRHKEPDRIRPIKLPLSLIWSFVACCAALTFLAFWNDANDSLIGVLLSLSGIPIYYFVQYFSLTKPGSFTIGLQRLFLIVESNGDEIDEGVKL